MTLNRWLFLCCAAVVCVAAPRDTQAAYIQVFAADFESGVPAEFSGGTTSAAQLGPVALAKGLSTYLGQFVSPGTTTLTLTGLAAHSSVLLQFDLYLFSTWDGSADGHGPDYFSLAGDIVFSETFTNHHGTAATPNQTYATTGDVFLNDAGTDLSSFGDLTSTQAFFNLGPTSTGSLFEAKHTTSTFSVTFGGITTNPDERWGIDNVRLYIETADTAAVPEPASFALFGLGSVGLAAVRRRRRAA